jgi:hypothetical protein
MLLAFWLAFCGPLLAGPVIAAPPETPPLDTSISEDPDPSASEDPGSGLLAPAPDPGTAPQDADSPIALSGIPLDSGSVRRRGLEAPVILQQQAREPEVADPAPDPGDGPVAKGGDEPPQRRKQTAKRKSDDRADDPARVWPMPPESYTFSQAFGCVPQLGNLYFADENCPPSAPVVHTGIDMAAPEGTPFYAAASGWITLAGYDRPTPDANTRIILQHDGKNDGYATEYLHWVATFVEVGDYVRAGQPIGEVGNVGFSTGPHLHFSVVELDSGEHVDPVRWLPKDANYDGYPGRLPRATFRLPAGTTAGQPEGADPAPSDPPRRVKVPDSLPDSGANNGARGERKKDRRGKDASSDAHSDGSSRRDRHKKKSAAKKGESSADRPRDGKQRDRVRTRERNRDGVSSSEASRGHDDGNDGERKAGKAHADVERRRDRQPRDPAEDGGDQRNTDKKRERDIESVTNPPAGDGEQRRGERDEKQRQDASSEESDGDAAGSADRPRNNHGEESGQDKRSDSGRKSRRK